MYHLKEKKQMNIIPHYNEPIEFEHQEFLRGVGWKFLKHPYFERFQEYLLTQYTPPENKTIGMFTVCSWGKPYSQSYIHYVINQKLYQMGMLDKIHKIVISNSGVIPIEWENFYPFTSYDWDPNYETEEIKQIYYEVTKERIYQFLLHHAEHYTLFFSYLRPDSESWRALRDASTSLNLEIHNIPSHEPTQQELEVVSLGGFYDDEDLYLITEMNLRSLVSFLQSLETKHH